MIDPEVFEPTIPIYFRECKSNKNAKTLIIAFTSHGGSGKMFELYKVLDLYNKTHQLFISPDDDKWFLGNVSKRKWSQSNVIDLIKQLIEEYNIEKVITVGNSAGGAGAIIYGWQIANIVKTSILACAPHHAVNLIIDTYCKYPVKYKDHFYAFTDFKFPIDYNEVKKYEPYLKLHHIEGVKHNVLKMIYLDGRLFKLFDDEIHLDDLNNAIPETPNEKTYYINTARDEGRVYV